MSFIRYKKFGNIEYAYEITAYWDRKEKKSRQHSKYLGIVVDKETKIFKKKEKKQHEEEKLILDFGDKTEYLLALIYYRLCYPSAMMYAKTWYQGSYARIISKDIDLSSQRISDFLKAIGEEHLQREYFKNHTSLLAKTNEGIIIDATSMPNQIHFPFNTWGYNDGGIDKQIRFLFVIDKKSSLPLYFRYLPGNIVDVSSLTTTIEELEKLIGFAKDDLDLIPLRVHREETLRGYLLLIFITLAVFVLMKKEVGNNYTVEEALLTMRNLKCKVYDKELIVQELAKQQKEIVENLDIIVPKKLGI